VLEDLRMPQVTRNVRQRPGIRRRLNQWPHGMMRAWIRNKAKEAGILVEVVDPRNTSQVCSRCGLKGIRKKHSFTSSSCGVEDHAHIMAARNTLIGLTVLGGRELASTSPEAHSVGKPPALAGGRCHSLPLPAALGSRGRFRQLAIRLAGVCGVENPVRVVYGK